MLFLTKYCQIFEVLINWLFPSPSFASEGLDCLQTLRPPFFWVSLGSQFKLCDWVCLLEYYSCFQLGRKYWEYCLPQGTICFLWLFKMSRIMQSWKWMRTKWMEMSWILRIWIKLCVKLFFFLRLVSFQLARSVIVQMYLPLRSQLANEGYWRWYHILRTLASTLHSDGFHKSPQAELSSWLCDEMCPKALKAPLRMSDGTDEVRSHLHERINCSWV